MGCKHTWIFLACKHYLLFYQIWDYLIAYGFNPTNVVNYCSTCSWFLRDACLLYLGVDTKKYDNEITFEDSRNRNTNENCSIYQLWNYSGRGEFWTLSASLIWNFIFFPKNLILTFVFFPILSLNLKAMQEFLILISGCGWILTPLYVSYLGLKVVHISCPRFGFLGFWPRDSWQRKKRKRALKYYS